MKTRNDKLADVVRCVHVFWLIFFSVCALGHLFLDCFFSLSSPCLYVPVITGCVIQLILNLVYKGCPLTKLENNLRACANPNYVPMKSFVSDICARRFGWDVPPEIVHLAIIILLSVAVMASALTAVVTILG